MKVMVLVAALSLYLLFGAQNNGVTPQGGQGVETHVDVRTPPTTDAVSLALSPDGDKIAFVADSEGKYQLWVHSLASGKARPLPGTDDVSFPFPCWSPDSHSIAFTGSARLKRIDVETGAIQTLVSIASPGRGCTWNRDGTILFATASTPSILRISDQGGVPQRATPPDPLFFSWPEFLPDGRHFLYFGGGGVHVGEIGGAQHRKLMTADSAAVYSRSGHLLFVRQATLYAQRFDSTELKLSGDPVPVAEPVPITTYKAAVSVSASGALAYRTGLGGSERHFKWFDRTGKELETVGEPLTVASGAPQLSPDGLSVILDRIQDGNTDIWILALATGKPARFTSDPGNDAFPVWSPDGRTVYFASNRTGQFELYRKLSSGTAPEELALPTRGFRLPRDVSRDGRFLLHRAPAGPAAVQLDGDPPGDFPVIQGQGVSDYGQFSPDGRWVAYDSNVSGATEVYLQQFPTGRSVQVSTNGGAHVRWRHDGKELFYISPDGQLMATSVELTENGQQAQLGTPMRLFAPPIISNVNTGAGSYAQQYMVSQDGQRFLIATAPKTDSPIKVIRNWQPKP